LTLEHLEASFYEEGLKNYTHEDFVKAGLMDPFYANLKEVAKDEKSHEEFLTQALKGKCCEFNGLSNPVVYVLTGILAAGAHPVERCKYAFPATDVKTFAALGSVLEGKSPLCIPLG